VEKWKQFEFWVAQLFGGSRHAFSGGHPNGDPGDVTAGIFRFDCKDTENKSYSVSSKVWEKIDREARFEGYVPAVAVRLVNDCGTPIELMVMSIYDVVGLVEEISALKKQVKRLRRKNG
jgi:hypothetical protein